MSRIRIILKNTIYLYIRQFLVLLIALYTTRVVLNTLGVDDFGLYNIIAGVVLMLSIVTASTTSATQRFLSISLGNSEKAEFDNIFDVCFTLFVILSFIVIVLSETIGLWFINTSLTIPHGREFAANWTYQLAVFTFVLQLIRVPYNAAIIAHEKMSFYAWVSIFQVVGQLLVAYSLYYIDYDHLIVYSILHTIVTFFTNIVYIYYCRKKIHVRLKKLSVNRKYFNSIFSFSFWTFFGALSTIGVRQGMNILINRFFGVRLNAASGISTKVSGAAYDFVANFTTAYRPQILKLYAQGAHQELYSLVSRTMRLSCYLFAFIMIPLQANIRPLLVLWLGTVPEYAEIFCILLIIYLFIDTMQSPLIVMVNAIGNIKRFQITFSILNILNLPIMWLLLHLHCPPQSIYVCFIVFNVITSMYRIIYVKNRSSISIRSYVQDFFKILFTIGIAYFATLVLQQILPNVKGWWTLFSNTIFILISSLIIVFIFGISQNERVWVKQLLLKKLLNN